MADPSPLDMLDEPLAQIEGRPGALAQRLLHDQNIEITLYRMIPGQTRLCIGPIGEGGFDAAFCYHGFDDAHRALLDYTGEGDPPGPWYRAISDGRRREWVDGALVREWVAW